MARQLKSAAEIQAEVSRLVHELEAVAEDHAHVGVPMPMLRAEDENGCNWDMAYVRNGGPYMEGIRAVIAEVQAKWNLDQPWLGSSARSK